MRILILNWKHLGDPTAGGAEHYVTRVAEVWAAQGHQVTMLLPSPGAGAAAVPPLAPGVSLETVGSRATIFHHARRYLVRAGADFDAVLESVSTRPFFAHELVGDRALVLYHQIADDVWPQEFPFPVSWVGRRVVEPHWLRRIRSARVAANSPLTAADLSSRGVLPVGVVPPGADQVPPPPDREVGRPPRVLFIGRLVRTKRPADAVRAFVAVRAVFPQATLDVLGDGYLRDELRGLAGPGVTVHGYVPAAVKSELLARSDLLLLPGTREGWGIVATEAALRGVPTVAYDVPGLRDAVVDGGTGTLTECNPESLGAGAVALLRDPERWRRYSQASRRRSARFTWQRSAEDLLALLPAESGSDRRQNVA